MAKTTITAKLGLDTTAFKRGMAKSQKSVNNFVKNGIAKFGALAGAAGLGMMTRAAIDLGSKISDLAIQLNIGTTELQVLDFAAREAGVGTEIMARALRNVQLRTEEAIKGNKSYGDAFKMLGIDIVAFKKLAVEEKMEAIAKAQSNATDKAAAYNAVSRILGEKAGPALQEVLQNLAGPQGYGGLEAAAKRAGEVMSKETIQKMDDAADKIESFKRRMTVMAAEVLTKVVPALGIFSNGLGFIGDIAGISAANFLAFGRTIGTVLKAVVAPAISQMEALGLAIKAAGQAASRDFNGAKESIKAAKDQVKETIGAIKDIPEKIGDAFNQLAEDQKSAWEVLGQSIDERASTITENLEDITGAAKEATDEINKTGAAIESTSKIQVKSTKETEKQVKKVGELKGEFKQVKREATGLLIIAKQIAKALGIDTNVKAKDTKTLEKERKFSEDQLKAIERFKSKNRSLTGKLPITVKMERANVQAQLDRINEELASRSRFDKLSKFSGSSMINREAIESFMNFNDVQRLDSITQENMESQNEILVRIQMGIENIRNTTSKLDRNLS